MLLPAFRLQRGDIAVTFHKAVRSESGGQEQCVVNSQPLMCSSGGTPVHILGALGMDARSVGRVLRWQPSHTECIMTLPGYATQADAGLLKKFISERAFEGQSAGIRDSAVPVAARATFAGHAG